MDLDIDPITGKALSYLNIIIFSNPKNPKLAQGESTMDDVDKAIFQEEIKEYIKENIYIMTLKKLCEILWDQTSENCFVKVQAVEKFK